MNGISGITEVLNRITAIENRFGVNQMPVTGVVSGSNSAHNSGTVNQPFSALLSGTGRKNNASEAAYQDASSDDVIRMIRLAAQKYGVDPKLAQAVAKAESGYSPDAVSSTGAVGVMQLMPDTAAGLGVRDIQDPRENIDGGVKYLKQMLDTFHGDVTQAVAAYNAGPQAVKDYQGIPPYAETQSYVANVLANYRSF